MKKIAVLITLIMGLFFSSVVYAEDDHPGSLAIGVHGIGTQWNYGRPTLRWRPSDGWAFDFTPVISRRDDHDNLDNKYKSDTYGLNFGVIKQSRNSGGLFIGWRMEIGYEYTKTIIRSGSYYSSSSNYERERTIDLGFGPDLEYFVPVVPGLSIGASAQIHYRYESDKYHYESNPEIADYNARLDLLGELLTVRYYF